MEAVPRPESFPTGVEGQEEKDDKDGTEYGEYEYPYDEVNGSVRSLLNVVVLRDIAGLVEHVAESPSYRDTIHLHMCMCR